MSRPFFYIDNWMEWSEHCKWGVTSNIGALNVARLPKEATYLLQTAEPRTPEPQNPPHFISLTSKIPLYAIRMIFT